MWQIWNHSTSWSCSHLNWCNMQNVGVFRHWGFYQWSSAALCWWQWSNWQIWNGTPLHEAAQHGHLDMVCQLIVGLIEDKNAEDQSGSYSISVGSIKWSFFGSSISFIYFVYRQTNSRFNLYGCQLFIPVTFFKKFKIGIGTLFESIYAIRLGLSSGWKKGNKKEIWCAH